MPIGVARGALDAQKGFSFAISVASANANLFTLANAAGYPGYGNCTITINSGVDIFSATGAAALVPGSFPTGVTVTLINKGYISGAGGGGGSGGGLSMPSYNGSGGGAGGTALDASGVSGFTFKVDRKSTRLNSSHVSESRMPSSA